MRARVVVALVGVVTLTTASCGGDEASASKSDTFTLKGTLTLRDGQGINYAKRGRAGERCWGEQGYDDIVEGAQIVVRDGDGTKVALGELGPGILTADSESYYAAPCRFVIYVPDVPDQGGVYSVSVASRGEVSFKPGDEVTLRLG